MSEESIKRKERILATKTVRRLDKESYWGSQATGKLAKIATATGIDKGIFKIVKSVYFDIEEDELKRLLDFNEAPNEMPCIIEIWFWKPKEREPFERKKLFYNQPDQRLNDDLIKLVKKKSLT